MTEPALVLAPLACSVVLLVSGVAKVRDPLSTREAMISLKVPGPLTGPAAVRSLPYAELGLGILLLVTWGWVLAVVGMVVTVLFLVYLALVALVLRRGDQVDCHCFGSLGSSHVTIWTVGRNAMLVLLAVLTVVFGIGGGGLPAVSDDLGRGGWAWVAMALAVAATTALVLGPGGDAEAAGEQLDYEREPIPFAMLESGDGERVTLRQLARERPQLLVFMAVGCGACTVVAERVPEWASTLGPVEVSGVFTEALDSLPASMALEGVRRYYDIEAGASQTFATNGRPAAVLIGADGKLAGGPVSGREAVVEFVDDIRAELVEAGAIEDAPRDHEPADVHSG